MRYLSPHKTFYFESYDFDESKNTAKFSYSFDQSRYFTETIIFSDHGEYEEVVLKKSLWLSFLLIGISYYKCFPTREVRFNNHKVTPLDKKLLLAVYHDGLSQFVFENHLNPDILPDFFANSIEEQAGSYHGDGILTLQSGGKDSLLLAELLKKNNHEFEMLYISSSESYPGIIDKIQNKPPRSIRRIIDREALKLASQDGALNGHVPITYITYSLAIIDAILHNENMVLGAIGHEGEEAHAHIKDLAINHQWSKTWFAEQLLAQYVAKQIAPELQIGSPLRSYSELFIAELFVKLAWSSYSRDFSSCNVANYTQGKANDKLSWCGECPKCANSFLLFAPFVEPSDLMDLFGGKSLFSKQELTKTFMGLLGIGDAIKPFECVGEIDELRQAYHLARKNYGTNTYSLPFEVPESHFDYQVRYPTQKWVTILVPNT